MKTGTLGTRFPAPSESPLIKLLNIQSLTVYNTGNVWTGRVEGRALHTYIHHPHTHMKT